MPLTLASPQDDGAEDGALAQRAIAGDHAAFAALMRRHNRTLFRTARAILKDDGEAEDAVQEAYLHAFHALPGFRGDARLGTWLVRIAANEALARLRTRSRRAAILPLHAPDADDEDAPAPDVEAPAAERPDSLVLRDEMRRLIEARIDALPEAFRTVFVLRALEELSVADTAASLGLSEATVRTRFFRARSQLREALARDVDRAYESAFGFAGERCDRIVAAVLARLPGAPTPNP